MMDGKVSRVSTTSTGSRGQLESIKKVAVTMTGQQALFMELNQVCYLLSKSKTFNAEKCPQCLNQKVWFAVSSCPLSFNSLTKQILLPQEQGHQSSSFIA